MGKCTSPACVGELLQPRDAIDIYFDTTGLGGESEKQAPSSSPRAITGTVADLRGGTSKVGALSRTNPR